MHIICRAATCRNIPGFLQWPNSVGIKGEGRGRRGMAGGVLDDVQ